MVVAWGEQKQLEPGRDTMITCIVTDVFSSTDRHDRQLALHPRGFPDRTAQDEANDYNKRKWTGRYAMLRRFIGG